MYPEIRRVTVKPPSGEYTFEQKFDVVNQYLQLGNYRLVAEFSGISYGTIMNWKATQWWKDLVTEIQASKRVQKSSKIDIIVEKGLGVVEDRLDNGELVLNQKTGSIERRDVSLKDAVSAVNALMQRQAVIENQNNNTADVESQKTIQEQLSFLANEFAKFNLGKKNAAVDVEYKEVS